MFSTWNLSYCGVSVLMVYKRLRVPDSMQVPVSMRVPDSTCFPFYNEWNCYIVNKIFDEMCSVWMAGWIIIHILHEKRFMTPSMCHSIAFSHHKISGERPSEHYTCTSRIVCLFVSLRYLRSLLQYSTGSSSRSIRRWSYINLHCQNFRQLITYLASIHTCAANWHACTNKIASPTCNWSTSRRSICLPFAGVSNLISKLAFEALANEFQWISDWTESSSDKFIERKVIWWEFVLIVGRGSNMFLAVERAFFY